MPFHMAATLVLAIAVAGACTLATKIPAGVAPQAKYYHPLPR